MGFIVVYEIVTELLLRQEQRTKGTQVHRKKTGTEKNGKTLCLCPFVPE
jgi:hypothetical protein